MVSAYEGTVNKLVLNIKYLAPGIYNSWCLILLNTLALCRLIKTYTGSVSIDLGSQQLVVHVLSTVRQDYLKCKTQRIQISPEIIYHRIQLCVLSLLPNETYHKDQDNSCIGGLESKLLATIVQKESTLTPRS